ncbi:MAG TPA: hypothetical protein P5110_09120 [Candidatus Omnitrophota bacterium]|nr:hypothetical protein [Candidatus Omnitrophota bacterium]HRZ15652.1 hypothetical protein [Candidatus Omnitrophota bacterium]
MLKKIFGIVVLAGLVVCGLAQQGMCGWADPFGRKGTSWGNAFNSKIPVTRPGTLSKTLPITNISASYSWTPVGGKVSNQLSAVSKYGMVSVVNNTTHAYTKEVNSQIFIMDTKHNNRVYYIERSSSGAQTSEQLTLQKDPARYRAVITKVTDTLQAANYQSKNADFKYLSDALNQRAGRIAPALADKNISAAVSYTPVSSKATTTLNAKVENDQLVIQQTHYFHYTKESAESTFKFDLATGRVSLHKAGYMGNGYEAIYRDENSQRYNEIVADVKSWLSIGINYADSTNDVGFQKALDYLNKVK